MSDELEWAKIRQQKPTGLENAKSGALRVTLLFGGLAVALGLFAIPLLDRDSDSRLFSSYGGSNIDPITTATTRRTNTDTYIVRRSVLQPTPSAKCILRPNGTATGDC